MNRSKRPLIQVVLAVCILALALLIITLILFRNRETGKINAAPNATGLAESFAHHVDRPACFSVAEDGGFYIGGGSSIKKISPHGALDREIELDYAVTALLALDTRLYAAAGNYLFLIQTDDEISIVFNFGGDSFIKSIKSSAGVLYVSDAGNKLLYKLNDGRQLSKIYSFNGPPALQIVSPWFDFMILKNGSFWITNPGDHQLDYYSAEGEYRKSIPTADDTILFEGCCNPKLIEQIDDEIFLAWEKGLERLRIFNFNGYIAEEINGDQVLRKGVDIVDMTWRNGVLYLLDQNAVYELELP